MVDDIVDFNYFPACQCIEIVKEKLSRPGGDRRNCFYIGKTSRFPFQEVFSACISFFLPNKPSSYVHVITCSSLLQGNFHEYYRSGNALFIFTSGELFMKGKEINDDFYSKTTTKKNVTKRLCIT